MRMLFTCRPAVGHFLPLVPLAEAARQRGHIVAFATNDPVIDQARTAGFEAFPAGLDAAASQARCVERGVVFRDLPPREMRRYAFGQWFSAVEAPPRLADLERICGAFQPNVLVHGVAELAAPLAATKAGIPWVTVGFGLLLPTAIATLAGEGVAPLWRAHGLPAPKFAGLYQHLYVDPFPRALQFPEIVDLPAVVGIRPAGTPATLAPRHPGSRRRTYVSFGTLWNNGPAAVALMRAAIAGSAGASEAVVVTLGRGTDPAVLGSLPANVEILGYVPQHELLPNCACAVSHAGSGTLLGALGWSVPSLLLPQFADQFDNAEQARRAGVALVLRDAEVTQENIACAIHRLLEEPAFAACAASAGAELSAMPDATAVLDQIEALAAR